LVHLGSAHEQGKLGLLLGISRDMIEQGQSMLDFGVEFPVRQASLLGPAEEATSFDGKVARSRYRRVFP